MRYNRERANGRIQAPLCASLIFIRQVSSSSVLRMSVLSVCPVNFSRTSQVRVKHILFIAQFEI